MAVKELASPELCEHVNLAVKPLMGYVGCDDCAKIIPPEDLMAAYVEYHRMVKTGIAVLTDELEQHRKDSERAAGELMVAWPPIDSTDPKDQDIRALVRANSLMRQERDKAREYARRARECALELAERVIDFAYRIHPSLRELFNDRVVGTAKTVLQVLKR